MAREEKRRDPGDFYPGGSVWVKPGQSQPQVNVKWGDIKNVPNLVKKVNGNEPDPETGNVNVEAIAEGAVQYDREQALTDEQKKQAQKNIGTFGKLPMKLLPKYLHALSFDDTYPADAAWLYAQLGPGDLGRCSAVRRGGKLWRNYDWTFDNAAEFVVRVSGNATRVASVGVASVGARLTENDVMSGINSPYYKCLPGMTLDGINEKGVVAEINVDGGPKSGWHGTGANALHILAAVRWVLDHGETAAQAAAYIAANVKQPAGDMNFHFMIADAMATYIVENGEAHEVTDGTKVLTNYALYDDGHAGGGKERYQLLARGADITAVWFTGAYQSGNDWDSDFDSAEQHAEAIRQWAEQGTDKEAHRGKTTTGGRAWWQSVHTTEYDFAAKTMRVAVQESGEYFTFAAGAKADVAWDDVTGKPQSFPPSEHAHAQGDVTGLADALEAKRDKTDLHVEIDRWVINGEPPAGYVFNGSVYWHEGDFWALDLKDATTGDPRGYLSSTDPQTATTVTLTGLTTVTATHEVINSDLALQTVGSTTPWVPSGPAAEAGTWTFEKADSGSGNYYWVFVLNGYTQQGASEHFETEEERDLATSITLYAGNPEYVGRISATRTVADEIVRKSQLRGKQDALTTQQLANIASVPGKLNATDVIAPSPDAAAGKAADAKATGEALDKKADEFTEWEFSGDLDPDVEYSVEETYDESQEGWRYDLYKDGVQGGFVYYTERSLSVTWYADNITATRKRVLRTGEALAPGLSAQGVPTDANVAQLFSESNTLTRYKMVDVVGNALAVQTFNRLAVTDATAHDLSFPAVASGRSRDFALRLEIGAGSYTPSVTFPSAPSATYEGDDFPDITPDATNAKAWILAFTETKANTWLVRVAELKTPTTPPPVAANS